MTKEQMIANATASEERMQDLVKQLYNYVVNKRESFQSASVVRGFAESIIKETKVVDKINDKYMEDLF